MSDDIQVVLHRAIRISSMARVDLTGLVEALTGVREEDLAVLESVLELLRQQQEVLFRAVRLTGPAAGQHLPGRPVETPRPLPATLEPASPAVRSSDHQYPWPQLTLPGVG